MRFRPDDVIVAAASPALPARRCVVRLSGAGCFAIVGTLAPEGIVSGVHRVRLTVDDLAIALPVSVYAAHGPATYTGQDTIEIHMIGSAVIQDAVVSALLKAGARSAEPGEFTMRSFLAGKRDLTQSEAVMAVVEAGSEGDLRDALGRLAGGIRQPLERLREDLLDLLADIEAGLDFTEEDISFVADEAVLNRIAAALAHLTMTRKRLQERSRSDRPFRVALIGAPNAGKSSLLNAILGNRRAIVSPIAGTTRDFVSATIDIDGFAVEWYDTAGIRTTSDAIETKAQAIGSEQARSAELRLWCVPVNEPLPETIEPGTTIVRTKADLGTVTDERRVSVFDAASIVALKSFVGAAAKAHAATTPSSVVRCREAVDACLDHLRMAHRHVLEIDPAELTAFELRTALERLGEAVGSVHTDDLLDRLFSRFCIGK